MGFGDSISGGVADSGGLQPLTADVIDEDDAATAASTTPTNAPPRKKKKKKGKK